MRKVLFVCLCLGITLGEGTGGAFAQGKADPTWEGKPMSEWIKDMQDKDPLKRRSAAIALVHIGKDARPVVPKLMEILKDDEDAYSRTLAAYVLTNISPDPKTAIPALVEAMKDKDAHVRRLAATGLVKFGEKSKTATEDLLKMLADPKEPDHRQLAAYVLGNIKADPDDVSAALRRVAALDKVDYVRTAAYEALKKLDPKALKDLDKIRE